MSSPTTLVAKPRVSLYRFPEVHYPIDLGLGVSLWELEVSKSGQNPRNPLSDDTANPYPYSTRSSTQQQEEAAWPNFTAQDSISTSILTPEESSPSTLVPSSSENPSEVPRPPFTTTTPTNGQCYPQSSSPEQLAPPSALTSKTRISPTPSIPEPISSPSSSPGRFQYQCSICSKTFDRHYKLK